VRQRIELRLRKPGAERDWRVMAVLVIGAVHHGDRHDHQLALAGWQLALLTDHRKQVAPCVRELRVVQQHPVQVEQPPATLSADAIRDWL